jgi:hypothetical protein
VGDQQDRAADREREKDHAGDRVLMGRLDDPPLVEIAKADAVPRHRRHQTDAGDGGEQEGRVIHPLLEAGHVGPALLKRHDE